MSGRGPHDPGLEADQEAPVTPLAAWVFVAIVVATLYLFFVVLTWSFRLIEKARAELQAEDSSPTGERGA